MSKSEMLRRWRDNLEKSLPEKEEELKELKATQEYNAERYSLYASIIKDWLKNEGDDWSDFAKERFEYEIEFLEEEPEEVRKKIKEIEGEIEKDKMTISKLNKMLN